MEEINNVVNQVMDTVGNTVEQAGAVDTVSTVVDGAMDAANTEVNPLKKIATVGIGVVIGVTATIVLPKAAKLAKKVTGKVIGFFKGKKKIRNVVESEAIENTEKSA